jgi:hypothetical protein
LFSGSYREFITLLHKNPSSSRTPSFIVIITAPNLFEDGTYLSVRATSDEEETRKRKTSQGSQTGKSRRRASDLLV